MGRGIAATVAVVSTVPEAGLSAQKLVKRRVVVLFAAFILLGLPEGVLGTAWPTMRAEFARPEQALATLLISFTVGYLVGTAFLGRIVDRLGPTHTVRAGVGIVAISLVCYAVAPVWVAAIAAAVALGGGAGMVDASVNAEIALHGDQRTMNLLHGFWGAGATLGPLAVTAVIGQGGSWRIVYGGLAAVQVMILIVVSTTRAPGSGHAADQTEPTRRYAPLAERPNLVLGATLFYFAVYVGAEVSIGQWTYSVLTETRGVGETEAGLAVAAYWGGLTAGRFALAWIGDRLHPLALLRWSGAIALVAALGLVVDSAVAFVALPVLGAMFAGMFPALVLMTSSWLKPDQVTRAVGWQLAASSAGAIVAAAILGRVAAWSGLGATIPAIVILVALLVAAHLTVEVAAR